MKKTILTILLCGVMFLGITGCGKAKNEFRIGEVSTTKITTNNNVTLTIKDDTLTNTGATLLLKNNSNNDYQYDEPYWIEIKQDGKWHKINIVIDFNSQAYTLKSGGTKELKLSWENGYGKLASGAYRIIKSINYIEENSECFNVAVEFTIE